MAKWRKYDTIVISLQSTLSRNSNVSELMEHESFKGTTLIFLIYIPTAPPISSDVEIMVPLLLLLVVDLPTYSVVSQPAHNVV